MRSEEMDSTRMNPSGMRAAALGALATFLLCGCGGAPPAAPLPRLDIDPARIGVAGLSSGAYMATQVHLALGARVSGAALFAGGPYGCAGGDLSTALSTCMAAEKGAPDVALLDGRVRERAASGAIAPLAALAGDHVYVWHGRADPTVAPKVGEAAAALYRALDPALDVTLEVADGAAHLLPTRDAGVDCAQGGSPWIGRCGIDGAGRAVSALFDAPAVDASAAPAGRGESFAFDQRPLFPQDVDPVLADTGHGYVPPQCRGARCGLLLVFHGCQQSVADIGRALIDEGGFNRAADAASLVVLYPQARASWSPLNPKGCWDWWGYGGDAYDTREGAQVRFVANLLAAAGVP
jgi:poly(3-hydroxybutyrate) depolymerase